MKRTASISLALPLVIAMGCAHSQGEKVRDARMERVDAQAQARNEAIDKEAEARREAIKKRYSAAEQTVENSDQPGQSATTDLIEVGEDRALYHADATTKLERFSVRLETAKEKLNVLGPRAPSAIQQTLQTAATEHNTLTQDVANLNKVTPDQWPRTKDDLEARMNTLDERLNKLNESIEDV